jgi:YHS domain-containing protein
VVVDAGDAPDAAALVEEPAITLTSDGAARVEALQPVNTLCPVSGKPIDAAYAIVHKGRVIGFCCGECLKQFVDEPGKFEVKGEAAR